MKRKPFLTVGALAALTLLLSAPIIAAADATTLGAEVTAPPKTVQVGQAYYYNPIKDGGAIDPGMSDVVYALAIDKTAIDHKYTGPAWLTMHLDTTAKTLYWEGTPTEPGAYSVSLWVADQAEGAPQEYTISWTINVVQVPYSVTLISDPMPTSISTSAGTVALQDGSATILGGTVMQTPDLRRERQILHRWTDAQGNTYDWSKPVASDLTLTAEWREHFTAIVTNNTATVTISPDLPSEYTTHQVDWGDNTVNSELRHLYALPGEYTITVRSGQWGTWARSSTVVAVRTVTELPTYTVTFGGTNGTIPAQTVQYGGLVAEPKAPTRDGHDFTGWYLDGKLYDFRAPVAGDLALTAAWTPIDDDQGDKGGIGALEVATVATIAMLIIAAYTRHPLAVLLLIVLAVVTLALFVPEVIP